MAAIKLELEAEELLACRICLATNTKLLQIHEEKLEEAFVDIFGIPTAGTIQIQNSKIYSVSRPQGHFYKSEFTGISQEETAVEKKAERNSTCSATDGFPQHACEACGSQLRRSAELRTRARASNDLLERLRQQHDIITTNCLRSIDRTALRLTDDKSHILVDYLSIPDYPANPDYPALTLADFQEPESSDSDRDEKSDVNSVANMKIVETVENGRNSLAEVKIVEMDDNIVENGDVKKEKKKRIKNEKKKVIKVKSKPEVEWVVKKKPVRKKKGFKRYFMCDQDYIKFEEKYNIQVIRLSEEEQALEMDARRRADSYRNALMRCESCCKGFLSAFTYENHLKVHDPAISGPNECRWCGCRFKWPNNLRTHMIEAHQLKYVCKQCQRVVKGRHEALLHAEFHAGKTWECGHCGRTFKKKSTFYTHVRMNHASTEPGNSTCHTCGASFKGPSGLKLHQIKKCNKNMKPADTEKGTAPAPALVARKAFICEVCGKNCTSLSILAVHLRAHTGDRPHACPGCPLRFAKKDNMEKHHRVVHLGQRPQVACGVCGKLLAHAASLKLHVNTVHLKLPAPPRAPRPPRTRTKDATTTLT